MELGAGGMRAQPLRISLSTLFNPTNIPIEFIIIPINPFILTHIRIRPIHFQLSLCKTGSWAV